MFCEDIQYIVYRGKNMYSIKVHKVIRCMVYIYFTYDIIYEHCAALLGAWPGLICFISAECRKLLFKRTHALCMATHYVVLFNQYIYRSIINYIKMFSLYGASNLIKSRHSFVSIRQYDNTFSVSDSFLLEHIYIYIYMFASA